MMKSLRQWQAWPITDREKGEGEPSPFVLAYGSFDQLVEREVLPGIEAGLLARDDMIEVVAALGWWEQDGTWERAFA